MFCTLACFLDTAMQVYTYVRSYVVSWALAVANEFITKTDVNTLAPFATDFFYFFFANIYILNFIAFVCVALIAATNNQQQQTCYQHVASHKSSVILGSAMRLAAWGQLTYWFTFCLPMCSHVCALRLRVYVTKMLL